MKDFNRDGKVDWHDHAIMNHIMQSSEEGKSNKSTHNFELSGLSKLALIASAITFPVFLIAGGFAGLGSWLFLSIIAFVISKFLD